MAFIVIPSPGTITGPCVPSCSHVDCRESRDTSALLCPHCLRALGYGVKLTGEPLAHYACELSAHGAL